MRIIVCTLRTQAALNMDTELLREGGHVYVSVIADGGACSPLRFGCDSSFVFLPTRQKKQHLFFFFIYFLIDLDRKDILSNRDDHPRVHIIT